jgi:type IV secretion system protein VirD4
MFAPMRSRKSMRDQQPAPEKMEREANVPKAWEQALDMREDFIEELLGGQ